MFFIHSPGRILVQAGMVSWQQEDAMIDLRSKWMKVIITAALMVSAGICYSCTCWKEGGLNEMEQESFLLTEEEQKESLKSPTLSGESEAEGSVSSQKGSSEDGESTEGPSGGMEAPQTETPALLCYVHISGAVQSPGVYTLEEGSRIFQAVEAAGGFLPQADEGYLNLAAQIYDGMKITVLTKEEAATAPAPEGGTGSFEQETAAPKVNINTAGKEQLMTLQGIGEARAADIIAYRQEHGPFQKIEDIMQISGIKEAAFAKIKDDITV